jgi:hypothetical protein
VIANNGIDSVKPAMERLSGRGEAVALPDDVDAVNVYGADLVVLLTTT